MWLFEGELLASIKNDCQIDIIKINIFFNSYFYISHDKSDGKLTEIRHL